jgi:hypothetical protein
VRGADEWIGAYVGNATEVAADLNANVSILAPILAPAIFDNPVTAANTTCVVTNHLGRVQEVFVGGGERDKRV